MAPLLDAPEAMAFAADLGGDPRALAAAQHGAGTDPERVTERVTEQCLRCDCMSCSWTYQEFVATRDDAWDDLSFFPHPNSGYLCGGSPCVHQACR